MRSGVGQNCLRQRPAGAWRGLAFADRLVCRVEIAEVPDGHDGERANRVWTIDRLGFDTNKLVTYKGQADDVKLAARGLQIGNALNWQYDITLEMFGANLDVHFDDWIYKQDEDIAINRAFVTKFGVEIGSVTIVFIRGKTASTLWPLSLDEWPSG